ncbi:aminoglycoside phosphotransferase family protein [Streptomyces sp. MAR4 CNY-716]
MASAAQYRSEPPERLVRHVSAHGDPGRTWLAGLSGLVDGLLRRWALTAERVHAPGGRTSVLVLVRQEDGTPAALKVAYEPERIAAEQRALEHWNGVGAVRLLRADAASGALLLERLQADVSLRSLAEAKAQLESAATLQRLWTAPPADHALPTVSEHTGRLAERLRELRAEPYAELVDAALERREALLGDRAAAGTDVLLHGDYHQGHVLAAERMPWLAVGPRPLVGERAYDLAWPARDRVDTLVAAPGAAAATRRRLTKLADSLDVDRDRLRDWTLFRCVATGVTALARGDRNGGELHLEYAGWL